MITEFSVFEKNDIVQEHEILLYLNKSMSSDKKQCTTRWRDYSWLFDEISAFIDKSYSSYVYSRFHNKYDYYFMADILIEKYKDIFSDVLSRNYDITLDEYLLKKDTEKYNL